MTRRRQWVIAGAAAVCAALLGTLVYAAVPGPVVRMSGTFAPGSGPGHARSGAGHVFPSGPRGSGPMWVPKRPPASPAPVPATPSPLPASPSA